ncbi:MAG: TraR/DksA family transcriptional regulator [Pyrinomonadaceae bacterium]
MDNGKLQHYKQLLLAQLRLHAQHVSEGQANAIELADDGAKESADLALRDLMSEMVLNLGERESQMIADIDQALLRMEEGSYGRCTKCNRQIDERRLEALPTARYDAVCQEAVEAESGEARPTL